jgi:crotonobetainyl-CoA:carnitine CoA-transferase CaiB-like acyl-CoA transferase
MNARVAAPLSGYRVVEFAGYIAGPGVGGVLADLGADVIKVESAAGDAARHMGPYGDAIWANCNRGKRSIVLDLQTREGCEAALRLVDRSDVLVQNLRPGAMQRLGLDAATVRDRNDRLVYISLTGYSSTGPNAGRLGFDVAAQAESGMMSITGERNGDPLRIGYPVVDVVTAHMGAEAAMAALLARGATGHGDSIEISMFDVAVHLQNVPLSTYLALGKEPIRTGNGQPYNAPSADVINTRDGQVVISAYPDHHWARLCQLIGRPDLITDARFTSNEQRVAHRPEMLVELNAALKDMDSEALSALLAENAIVAGIVRSYPQLTASAEFQAAEMVIRTCEAGADPVPAIGLPYRMQGTRTPPHRLPAVGEHTEEILAWLTEGTFE